MKLERTALDVGTNILRLFGSDRGPNHRRQ